MFVFLNRILEINWILGTSEEGEWDLTIISTYDYLIVLLLLILIIQYIYVCYSSKLEWESCIKVDQKFRVFYTQLFGSYLDFYIIIKSSLF